MTELKVEDFNIGDLSNINFNKLEKDIVNLQNEITVLKKQKNDLENELTAKQEIYIDQLKIQENALMALIKKTDNIVKCLKNMVKKSE